MPSGTKRAQPIQRLCVPKMGVWGKSPRLSTRTRHPRKLNMRNRKALPRGQQRACAMFPKAALAIAENAVVKSNAFKKNHHKQTHKHSYQAVTSSRLPRSTPSPFALALPALPTLAHVFIERGSIIDFPILTILWRGRRLNSGKQVVDLLVGMLAGQPANIMWSIESRRSIRGQVSVVGWLTALPAIDVMRA